jgi:hypothetical protein
MESHDESRPEFRLSKRSVLTVLVLATMTIACTTIVTGRHSALESPHLWDPQYGHVVPHDMFPGGCDTCHVTSDMPELVANFSFDHEAETDVRLEGAHKKASCLRCHNNRGPVAEFAVRGCAGCHANPHLGSFGDRCSDCHGQNDWTIRNVEALHRRTRFPHTGAHAAVACFRCHEGAQVGNFRGESASCESCHQDALASAPSFHLTSGLTTDCQRCHRPITWKFVQ